MKTIFVVAAVVVTVILLLFVIRVDNTFSVRFRRGGEKPSTGCGKTGTLLQENFVPSNSYDVPNKVSSIVELDALSVKAAFNQIMQQDRGIFRVDTFAPFRPGITTNEQSRQYIRDVLERINITSNRRYAILDIQSVKKESSFDPSDNGIVDRYVANLFVQEHDSRQVHAAATNISMTFLVKPSVGDMQITDLHFITDFYYDGPLVDGNNIYDKFFRILNPFHLNKPFATSNDNVLADDNSQISLLKNKDKIAKSPGYRCFGNSDATTQQECDSANSYWDTPVKSDKECPFYQSNKNFNNVLGGVSPDGQFCQLPTGMKRIGYRYFSSDPADKPFCYGCKIGADGSSGGAGPCCDEQRNKTLYPNLVTPDYMFAGDPLERGQNWRELGDRGIHWQANVTSTRNVTDRNQKQPVFNAIIGPGVNNN